MTGVNAGAVGDTRDCSVYGGDPINARQRMPNLLPAAVRHENRESTPGAILRKFPRENRGMGAGTLRVRLPSDISVAW
ncbi:MAG: hypothetical protein JWP25_2990 [Bradyrhizobium sp.]|nr:hypothetical protein [Bradyrhizobium sp.]